VKRTTRLLGAAATALALVITACSSDQGDDTKAATEKVSFLTGVSVQGRESYVYVAKEKGFFRAAGFEVDVRPGNGTVQNLQLLQGGRADFAVVDITGALIEYGKGTFRDFQVVSALQQRNLACLMALEGNDITGPKDLAGKKIAYIPGGIVKTLFPTYAGRVGLDASKVQWVVMPAQQMGQGLAAGSIDAATQFVVGRPAVEAAAKGRKAVVMPYSDVLVDLYGNGLAVTTKAAKDDPDRVKRFNQAVLKGLAYAIENPAEAGQIYAKYQKLQPQPVAAAEVELMAPYVRPGSPGAAVGGLDEQRVARNIALLRGAGAIPTAVDPDDVVAFEFAPKG
jgi:NitT/TauT family transport system substrate-binding protein